MKVQKILITGGSGFLGQHLGKALLAKGYEVLGVDLRPNATFQSVTGDVRDADLMKETVKNVDLVFHLAGLIEAGESVREPAKFIDHNVLGTLQVLEAMRVNGVKNIVFSSSAAIYGEPSSLPIKEDDRTLPISPYGMTKLSMEALISAYVYNHKLTGVALRYFNLYGPGEHHEPETHAIPRFIVQIRAGEEVTVWGDGGHGRDYIYIDDVVDAHLKTIALVENQPEQYHYFNLSTEQAASVVEIVNKLEKILGQSANIKHFPPRPGDPRILVADAQKAKEQLNWQTKIDLNEGLKRTVAYFLAQVS